MTIEELIAALKAIIDAAEGRALTDEEVERYEKLEVELATANKDQEIRSRQKAYETPVRSDLHLHVGESSTTAKRSDEERAFEHYMRTGQVNGDLEYRAQSEASGAAGGYLVPEGFRAKITERLKAFGGISMAAEHLPTSTGNPLPWPTNDDTANEGEIVAENAAAAGGADLVFGVKTLGAYKYESTGAGGLPVKVSIELLQDSAFDLEGFLSRKLGERIGRKQARDFAVGTGVGQPQGLLTGLAQGVNIVGATPTYAELVAVTHVPDVLYRQNASWVMNDAIMSGIESLVDLNGRPLLNTSTDGIGGRPSPTILGYPVIIDNSLPAAWVNNVSTVVFGDVSAAYVVRDVKDITLITLRELYAVNGQVGFLAWQAVAKYRLGPPRRLTLASVV